MATTSRPLTTQLSERSDSAFPAVASARSGGTGVGGWLLIVLSFVCVVEIACRVEDWVMYRMPVVSRYRSLDDLVVRDATGMHGRPNAQFEKWTMNDLGMRGPAASIKPVPGSLRVIAVGASETFGLYESPQKEYPRQLEDSLNVRLSRSGCAESAIEHFEVLNAAFAGMGLPTIEQDVRKRLAPLDPKIIVIYPSPPNYLDELAPVAARPDSSTRASQPASLWRALYPRAVARLREQLKQVLPEIVKTRLRARQTRAMVAAHPPDWRFATVPAERLTQYDADLRKLIGTVRAVGATPVLVTHANKFWGRPTADGPMLVAWEKFYPRATGETIIALDSAARDATLRAGSDSGVVTVDAARTLRSAPLGAFADFVHFTDFGASLMAGAVSDGVLAAACAGGQRAGLPVTGGR
ncbi:MAG TPA: hypothetical protein VGP95_06915 [Gemmatimonadaceae bacterium]|jgi:hypothetical protein|nr:hypothetical protein [Gemmatimonadaceae bacterium]